MPNLCPHCGYDIARDKPIELGEWRLAPQHAEYRHQPLPLTPQQAFTLYSIAKARPRPISAEALLNRISHDGRGTNLVSVVIHRLRKILPSVPFVSVNGLGYRWAA